MPISERRRETEAAMSTQAVLGKFMSPRIENASHPYYPALGQKNASRRTPSDQSVFNVRKRGLQAAMPCLSAVHQW